MALTTIERQRLRAALNNIELANRIEVMLNHVDGESNPASIQSFMKPKSPLAIDGFAQLPQVAATESTSVSYDIAAAGSLSVNSVAEFVIQDDTHSLGASIDAATGVITFTAPAFDGSVPENNFYALLVSCASAYGVVTFGVTFAIALP